MMENRRLQNSDSNPAIVGDDNRQMTQDDA